MIQTWGVVKTSRRRPHQPLPATFAPGPADPVSERGTGGLRRRVCSDLPAYQQVMSLLLVPRAGVDGVRGRRSG